MRNTTLKCNKRIRDIDPKEYSRSGRLLSTKTKNVIEFESDLERDFIHILEFDDNVKCYVEQPFSFSYMVGKTNRVYTPDFYVEYFDDNRPPEVIEVKFEQELKEKKQELKHKFSSLDTFCKENGMLFKVLTEKEIRENPDYLENVKLLGRYRNDLDPYCVHNRISIDITNRNRIMAQISNTSLKTIEEHVLMFSSDPDVRYEVFYFIFNLLATKGLKTDMFKKITKSSFVWI